MSEAVIRKIIPNLIVLGALVAVYAVGHLFSVAIVRDVFARIDVLTGNLLLVLVAITMGILVDRYLHVAASVVVILGLMVLMPWLFPFGDLPAAQIVAVAFMLLGFSAIANIFRHTRHTPQ